MEKSTTEILRELTEELAVLKKRLADIEETTARLLADAQASASAPEDDDIPADFTDMEFGIADLPAPEEDLPETEAPVLQVTETVVAAPTAETEATETAETVAPPTEVAETIAPPEPAPLDLSGFSWSTAQPGIPVKNIRSGISLLDRALFIGTLFKEDFARYDATISELNTMETLSQAVSYLMEHFPEWNYKSDIVYSFMMALRKKLG